MYSDKLNALLNDVKFYENYKNNIGFDPKEKSEGEEYSQFELYCGFELIVNKEHWKEKINTTIHHLDYALCNQACVHFTGGWLDIISQDGDNIDVSSDGYYVHIGA